MHMPQCLMKNLEVLLVLFCPRTWDCNIRKTVSIYVIKNLEVGTKLCMNKVVWHPAMMFTDGMFAITMLFAIPAWLKNMLFHHPVNCGDPAVPDNGFISSPPNTCEGAQVIFRCKSGFCPHLTMLAVCKANGMWNPDPGDLVCTKKPCKSTHSVEEECSYSLVSNISIRGI